MSVTQHNRLTKKLQEQLGFVLRSCAAFDQGAEDEAIRIATSLRVIFHTTAKSISLATHLGLDNTNMLSSSRGFGDYRGYLSVQLDLQSPQPVKMLPLLGNEFKELSMDDWWKGEPVFVHDSQRFSRRMIVLSAANKDGGAHVDENLEKYYEVLCAGEYSFGLTGNLEYNGDPPFPQGVTHYATNAHLALIRQFAHETLNSAAYFGWLNNEP